MNCIELKTRRAGDVFHDVCIAIRSNVPPMLQAVVGGGNALDSSPQNGSARGNRAARARLLVGEPGTITQDRFTVGIEASAASHELERRLRKSSCRRSPYTRNRPGDDPFPFEFEGRLMKSSSYTQVRRYET